MNGPQHSLEDDEPQQPSDSTVSATKVGDVTDVERLLRFAYDRHGRTFNITAHVMKELRTDRHTDPTTPDPLSKLVLTLGRTDPFLVIPSRLFAAVESADPPTSLRRRLSGLISLVLLNHPLLASPTARGALLDGKNDFRRACTAIVDASRDVTAQDLGVEKQLTQADRARLRRNAITALGHIFVARDQLDLNTLMEVLDELVWQKEPGPTDERGRGLTLLAADDYQSLTVVTREYGSRNSELLAMADREAARIGALLDQNSQLRNELGEAHQQAEAQDHEIRRLEAQVHEVSSDVQTERYERLVDDSHHIDRYMQLRARVITLLRTQTVELQKALAALRKGHPAITDEYVEHAIERLSTELDSLNRQGDDE